MNTRDSLLAALAAYAADHPAEAPVDCRIRGLIETRPNCYVRSCLPGHLTASAWVVSADTRRSVLMLHRKLGKWLQPGGHADGEFDLEAVALREATEETGLGRLQLVTGSAGQPLLDVDVHDIPARRRSAGALAEPAHEHHDLRFLLRVNGDETLSPSKESDEMRWCDDAEVRRLTDESSVLRLLRKARRRLAETGG